MIFQLHIFEQQSVKLWTGTCVLAESRVKSWKKLVDFPSVAASQCCSIVASRRQVVSQFSRNTFTVEAKSYEGSLDSENETASALSFTLVRQASRWKSDRCNRTFSAKCPSSSRDVLVRRFFGGFAKFGVQSETCRWNTRNVREWRTVQSMFDADKQDSTLTKEDEHGADPLQGGHDVPKQDDWAQDGEELPGGGDDGAGQRPEAHHRHEDKGLEKGRIITTVQQAGPAEHCSVHHSPAPERWSRRTAGCCRWCSGGVR